MPPLYETTLKCYFFLYPHFGHTPSLFKVTPHNGQRSILFFVSNSAEPAFTPLVKVILAIFNFSFRACLNFI